MLAEQKEIKTLVIISSFTMNFSVKGYRNWKVELLNGFGFKEKLYSWRVYVEVYFYDSTVYSTV